MTRKHRGAFFVCREQSRRFPVVRALVRGAGARFPGAFVVFVYFYPRAAARGRGGLKVFFLSFGLLLPYGRAIFSVQFSSALFEFPSCFVVL